MNKIAIFGLSRSGKTHYVNVMAKLMQDGVSIDSSINSIKMFASIRQQNKIDENINIIMNQRKWLDGTQGLSISDDGTEVSTHYDERLSLTLETEIKWKNTIQQYFKPQFKLYDYRGGVWVDNNNANENGREILLREFHDARVLMLFIDSEKLLKAMNNLDLDITHRITDTAAKSQAHNEILIMNNIYHEYYKYNNRKPPVLVVITKSDLFIRNKQVDELKNAKEYIHQNFSSIFSVGSGCESAITWVSLGTNLQHTNQNNMNLPTHGNIEITTKNNLHIPMLYSLLAYIDSTCQNALPEDEQKTIDNVLTLIKMMLKDRIIMYKDGKIQYCI